jgi:hypothetical protein
MPAPGDEQVFKPTQAIEEASRYVSVLKNMKFTAQLMSANNSGIKPFDLRQRPPMKLPKKSESNPNISPPRSAIGFSPPPMTMPSSKIEASPESDSPGTLLQLKNQYVDTQLLDPQLFLHQDSSPRTPPPNMPTSRRDFSVTTSMASSATHLNMGEIAATLPPQHIDHQNALSDTPVNRDISLHHGSSSSEVLMNMANMTLMFAAQDNIALGSLSQARDVGSKPLTINNSLPNASPTRTVLADASLISPPNPFRAGRVKVKHNMSFEEKKANIARECLAAAAATSNERPAHHHSEGSTSSSITNKNTQRAKPAANVEKRLIVNAPEEEDVKTIYNPDAGKVPIRIYVSGEDPTYVEPAPLQWNKNSAEKWEKEKAEFVKRGLTKIKEFAGEDRNCVYYYECM